MHHGGGGCCSPAATMVPHYQHPGEAYNNHPTCYETSLGLCLSAFVDGAGQLGDKWWWQRRIHYGRGGAQGPQSPLIWSLRARKHHCYNYCCRRCCRRCCCRVIVVVIVIVVIVVVIVVIIIFLVLVVVVILFSLNLTAEDEVSGVVSPPLPLLSSSSLSSLAAALYLILLLNVRTSILLPSPQSSHPRAHPPCIPSTPLPLVDCWMFPHPISSASVFSVSDAVCPHPLEPHLLLSISTPQVCTVGIPKSHKKSLSAMALTTHAHEGFRQNQAHASLSMMWGHEATPLPKTVGWVIYRYDPT